MKNKIILSLVMLLSIAQLSFAGATEDLWTALKGANYPNALTAITAGADVKSLDPAFGTPLNLASCWADANVVKALIDAKSEINFVATNGNTPLMNAAAWGNTEAVKLLLAAGADVKMKNKIGSTMLSMAIPSVKLEIIKLLVAAGADPLEKFDVMSVKGITLMNTLIVAYEGKEKIEHLKATGTTLAKLNVTYPPSIANAKETDFTPLYDLAKYLIEKGVQVNQKVAGTWGSTIYQATEFGKTGVVLAMIEAKADMEVIGQIHGGVKGRENLYDATPLLIAALKGNNELVEAFCKAGANVNYLAVQSKGTVTTEATTTGTTYTRINTTEYNTALSLASDNGHPETAEIIKKYGGLAPKEAKKLKKK